MEPLSSERLQEIAALHGITYETPESKDDSGRAIETRISRNFPIRREDAFNLFANPQNHGRWFSIIRESTPLIPMEGAIGPNEYIALEHVQEANLPPRMMVVKYTLNSPTRIDKIAVTDPFADDHGGGPLEDKKKGKVSMIFEEVGPNVTNVTCESTFVTNGGNVFVRGFIDHVWLGFVEKLMVELGELDKQDMLTDA